MLTHKIHKYVRVKNGPKATKIYYKCAIPGCIHKVEKPFAVGRFSICNICNEQFVLDSVSLQLSKPHCARCTKSEKKDELNNLTSLVERLKL